MNPFFTKLLVQAARYLLIWVAGSLAKFIKSKLEAKETAKKIKEAMAAEDRIEAAKKLNEIFK